MRFLAGFISALAMVGLYQDMLGMERYVAMVRIGWMDSAISVPIELAWLLVAWLAYRKGESHA